MTNIQIKIMNKVLKKDRNDRYELQVHLWYDKNHEEWHRHRFYTNLKRAKKTFNQLVENCEVLESVILRDKINNKIIDCYILDNE